MSSQADHGSRNAFAVDFLARLDELGEPDGAHEADVAGPWLIQPVTYRGGGGYALLREWESLEGGDVPYAVFRRREIALLAAAVLPATGREPLLRLAGEPDEQGFALLAAGTAGGDPAGRGSTGVAGATGSKRPAPSAPSELSEPSGPSAPSDASNGQAGAAALRSPAGEAVGHLRDFDEAFVDALRVAVVMVRSPLAIARLLEAAGHVALAQAGRILDRQVPPPVA